MSNLNVASFHVRNYKAIKHAEVEFGEYNIIIGKNDVGKSSLLEAIDLLLNFDTPGESDFHMMDESNAITLHCKFEEIPNTLKEALDDKYIEGSELDITVRYESASGRTPDKIEINGEEIGDGAIKVDEEEYKSAASRKYIENKLPETVTVIAERDYDSETSLKRGSWLTKLTSPILNSEEINAQKRDIRSELEKEFEEVEKSLNEVISEHHPHINNITVDIKDIDLAKSISPEIKVRDDNLDEWIPLSDRGSGVGNQLILSMMKSYAESEYDDGYSVLYEEPENSLHPSAVREMGKTFREISRQGNQVIITTHSPSLIDGHENGNLIVASNEDGEAEFEVISENKFELLEAIGAKNSDILQSDYVLYTEGASDAAVLRVICQNEYEDWNSRNMTIQPAGGANLEHQLENMKQINRNSGIFIDSDRNEKDGELGGQSEKLKKKADELDLDCWILERREIENYFHPEAISEVLETEDDVDIGPYQKAEDILTDRHGYKPGKVSNARKIAEKMYEKDLHDEFSEIKETVGRIV